MSKQSIALALIGVCILTLGFLIYQQLGVPKSSGVEGSVVSDEMSADGAQEIFDEAGEVSGTALDLGATSLDTDNQNSVSGSQSASEAEAGSELNELPLFDLFGVALNELYTNLELYNQETDGSFNVESVQAMNQIEFEMVVLLNQLALVEEGRYLKDLPQYSVGNPVSTQYYYDVSVAGDSYILCRYSLLEATNTEPRCFSDAEALDFLKWKNSKTANLESRETLLKYHERLGTYVNGYLSLSSTGEFTPLADLNGREVTKSPTFAEYTALAQSAYNVYLTRVKQNHVFVSDISNEPVSLDDYINSETHRYVTQHLVNLLFAYKSIYSRFPSSIDDLLPSEYKYTGTYVLESDAQDFKLCDNYPYKQLFSSSDTCFDKREALDEFMRVQARVDTVNNSYINAIYNTSYLGILFQREDMNVQLGLITFIADFDDFKAKYGRLPNDIDEFYNEYQSHYKNMVDSGYLKLGGEYNETTKMFDVQYQVIDSPVASVSITP